MLESNVDIYLGESRAIELEVVDSSFITVPVSGAFYEIYDVNSKILQEETVAAITDINKIGAILTPEILKKSAIYFIIWKIIAFNQEFKHKTKVYVKDFL